MAASTRYLIKGNRNIVVNVTGVWAVADETDTIIIDKSTLVGPLGVEPGSIRVDEITWTLGPAFDAVLLEWDHTTDDVVDYYSGQGYMDYMEYGGKNDPKSAGGTGDLILSTIGGAANDTYSLLISCTLKA